MDLSKFFMFLSLLTKQLLNSDSVSILLHKDLSLSWLTYTTNVSDPASTSHEQNFDLARVTSFTAKQDA